VSTHAKVEERPPQRSEVMHALDAIATALPGPDAITTALIAMKAIEDAQLKVVDR